MTCNYCLRENSNCVHVSLLTTMFQPILQIYQEVRPNDEVREAKHLHLWLHDDWGIFNDELDLIIQKKLLFDILNANFDHPTDIFNPNENYVRYDKTPWYEDPSLNWRRLCNEIKYKNRYLADNEDVNQWIRRIIDDYKVANEKGATFYRCRIGSADGMLLPYPNDQMGPPPRNHAKGGRANSSGIPFLYMATDIKTAISEVRPWKNAKVTVATMVSKKQFEVVDLNGEDIDSPFYEDIRTQLETLKFLDILSEDLSTPVSPQDSEIEYAPTQLLTEIIRSYGVDGIIFKSSLGPELNIVIFEPDLFEVTETELYIIEDVDYEFDNAR